MHQVNHYRTTVLVSYAVNILSGILKVFGCLLLKFMSMRTPMLWFQTRSDSIETVQRHNMALDLVHRRIYYTCSENKSADLRS